MRQNIRSLEDTVRKVVSKVVIGEGTRNGEGMGSRPDDETINQTGREGEWGRTGSAEGTGSGQGGQRGGIGKDGERGDDGERMGNGIVESLNDDA